MDFVHVKFRVTLLSLLTAVFVHGAIQANRSDSKQNCKELLCPASRKSYESKCFKIELEEIKLEREYYGVLVIYNQSSWWCKASLMLNVNQTNLVPRACIGQEEHKPRDCRRTKAQQVPCTKSCQMNLLHRPIRSRGELDKGFNISFKHRNYCNNRSDGVLIIRRKYGSFDAHACLRLETYRQSQAICVCLENPKPTSKQKGTTNQRESVRNNLLTYCLVVTCLLLEVLTGVVLHFGLWRKCWRGREVENTATNPIYQQGPLRPQISEPLPVTAQKPYQYLAVDITGPGGSSAEYRGLEGGQRDDNSVGVPVDQTGYQELVQTKQREKYQCLVADATLEGRECQRDERDYDKPKSEGTLKETDVKPSRIHLYYSTVVQASASLLHSLRSLGQSTNSRGCSTSYSSPNKHHPSTGSLSQSTNEPRRGEGSEVTTKKAPGPLTPNNYGDSKEFKEPFHYVIEELEAGANTSALDGNCVEEPLYYVLEEPLPASESNRDAMYHVLKELESLNANGAKSGASSRDSIADPLYYVLEDPKDLEDKEANV